MAVRDRIKSFRRVRAKDLLTNPKNWRTHSDAQANALRGILAEVGYADALLARETEAGLMLIDGHLRAETTPDQEVPVLVLDVTAEEADKILATLDPLASMADANQQKLGELLREIDTESEELQAMLDSLAEENDIDLYETNGEAAEDPGAQIDKAAELQEKWGTERGQLWEIVGKQTHRLLCGDSTDEADVATVMDGDDADLVFTSPPYGQQRDYTDASDVSDWDGLMNGVFGNLPTHEKTQVLVNLGLIHRDCEWIPYWESWIEWMREQGWRRFGWYVWDQGPGLPGDWNGRLAPSHEFVFHFNKNAQKPYKWTEKLPESIAVNHGGMLRGSDGVVQVPTSPKAGLQATKIADSVLRIMRHKARGIECQHPAIYPVRLPESVMKSWLGSVYDPFLGSGTTMVAAEQLSRRCYGMEIEPKYVAVALERMAGMGCEAKLIK
jgi:DNA modification methylase